MRRFVTLACSLVVAMVLAAGCTQADGEPCQENDDCSSGLCCPTTGRAVVERGTCMAMCVVVTRDAGPGTDAGVRDAGERVDAAAAEDASAGDDASVDAGGLDAGADIDSGSPTDAGFDAATATVDAGTDAGTAADAG